MLRRLLLIALVTFSLPTHADALTDEKKADIRELLEMTGVLDIGKRLSRHFVARMVDAIRQEHPDLEPRIVDIVTREVQAAVQEATPAFVDFVIPIYAAHFEDSEIKGLLRFYHTDLGRKTIRVMPLVMGESRLVGQRWGKALGPEIVERVKERLKPEGIDLPG